MNKTIKLYWWREASGQRNFGDDLAPLLVERLTGRRVQFADLRACDMISTGSLLDEAIRVTRKRLLKRPFRRTLVWGTGSFGAVTPGYHHLSARAVRGPLTRKALGLPDSVVLGDPALLLPRIVDAPPKSYRWGIIPHVIHREGSWITELAKTPRSTVIDLAAPNPLDTARSIASCEFVISSSLHGLIAADAFGIPSVWMRPSQTLFGGEWKFQDYFQSVGREGVNATNAVNLLEYENKADHPNSSLIMTIADDLLRALPY